MPRNTKDTRVDPFGTCSASRARLTNEMRPPFFRVMGFRGAAGTAGTSKRLKKDPPLWTLERTARERVRAQECVLRPDSSATPVRLTSGPTDDTDRPTRGALGMNGPRRPENPFWGFGLPSQAIAAGLRGHFRAWRAQGLLESSVRWSVRTMPCDAFHERFAGSRSADCWRVRTPISYRSTAIELGPRATGTSGAAVTRRAWYYVRGATRRCQECARKFNMFANRCKHYRATPQMSQGPCM